MADLHEAVFSWPDAGAHDVIVTGTFDNWSSSIHMTKTPSGFEAKVKVPWGQKILYKFVVDGTWLAAQGQPTELDGWTVNNFYHAPEKPIAPVQDAPPAVLAPEAVAPEPTSVPEPAPEPAQGVLASATSAITSVFGAAHEFASQLVTQNGVTPIDTPVSAKDGVTEHFPAVSSTANGVVEAAHEYASKIVDQGTATAPAEVPAHVNGVAKTEEAAPEPVAKIQEPAVNGVEKAAAPEPVPAPEEPLPTPSLGAEPVERAPRVPLPILPLGEQVSDTTPATATNDATVVPEASTHAPVVVASPAASPEPAAVVGDSVAPITKEGVERATETPSTPPPRPETPKKEAAAERPTTPKKETPTTPKKEEAPSAPATPNQNDSRPSTPSKKQAFPASGSPGGSPSSSKFNTPTRKKRNSIFGKIKDIFHKDEKLSPSPKKERKQPSFG